MTFNKKMKPVKISNYFKYWKLDNLKIEGNNDNSHNNGLPQKIVAFQLNVLILYNRAKKLSIYSQLDGRLLCKPVYPSYIYLL